MPGTDENVSKEEMRWRHFEELVDLAESRITLTSFCAILLLPRPVKYPADIEAMGFATIRWPLSLALRHRCFSCFEVKIKKKRPLG